MTARITQRSRCHIVVVVGMFSMFAKKQKKIREELFFQIKPNQKCSLWNKKYSTCTPNKKYYIRNKNVNVICKHNTVVNVFCLGLEGKRYLLEQLSRTRFLRGLKIPPFSFLLRSSGEKGANFKSRKKSCP